MPETKSKGQYKTDSNIEIRHIYTEEDAHACTSDLGNPGEFPFTRGIYPNMYRGKLWTMRQYSGYATAEETNQRFRYLLKQGQTGLSVAFDLPTQMGYDSDHPMSDGEVGKSGVAIDSLNDMEILFKDIQLDKISTSMTINSTAAILLAMYIAVAKIQGANLKNLRGTIQNDILKEYIARSTYIYPPAPSMRLVMDIFEYCRDNLSRWNTISISGYHIREAGSNAVQELAFTFANAIAYVSAAITRGLNIDEFGARLSFFFACHNNFFEEIAKFRAARRIWAKIMKENFNARNPKTTMLRFHTQTAGSSLTAQQPDNNIIRVTIQALAAVLGGTQSIHTNSKDEALALPSEEAAKLALRTQQVIAHESGVVDTVDPIGGSYFVETLTHEIEKKVFEYLDKIAEMGGAIQAIENKFFQKEISKSAYEYQKAVESKEKIVVGVNEYNEKSDKILNILKVEPAVRNMQINKLQILKKKRNNQNVKSKLNALQQAVVSNCNLMPKIIDCVEALATLGEISDALKKEFGDYTA